MEFNQLRDMANRDILLKSIARAGKVEYSACRQGKPIMSSSKKKKNVAKG